MGATHFTEAHLHAAVTAAVRAPSLHNSQPWRFRLHDGGIELRLDPTRRMPRTDPSRWGARIGCGAALFNMRLALAVAGAPARVRLRPYPGDPDVLARLTPDQPRPATPTELDLHGAVPRRFSNRAPFRPDPVPPQARWQLTRAALDEGGWLELIIGTAPVGAVAEIVRSAHRVLGRDPDYQAEIAQWTRYQPASDGVPVESGGVADAPHDLLPQRLFAVRERAPGRDFEAEPLVAVLGSLGDSVTDQLTAGQALQRVLLTATTHGLSASMFSQPIEVPRAREQLRRALGRSGTPQMVIRIGYGEPGWPTPRRDPAEVIDTLTSA